MGTHTFFRRLASGNRATSRSVPVMRLFDANLGNVARCRTRIKRPDFGVGRDEDREAVAFRGVKQLAIL